MQYYYFYKYQLILVTIYRQRESLLLSIQLNYDSLEYLYNFAQEPFFLPLLFLFSQKLSALLLPFVFRPELRAFLVLLVIHLPLFSLINQNLFHFFVMVLFVLQFFVSNHLGIF